MLIQTFSQQTPPVSIATLRPKITALTSCFQTSYVLCYVHDLFHLSHHITYIQNMKRQHFYDVVLVLDLMRVWYFIYYIRDPFIQFNPIVLFTWREFCQSKTMASQITKKSHMSISLVWWALSPSLSLSLYISPSIYIRHVKIHHKIRSQASNFKLSLKQNSLWGQATGEQIKKMFFLFTPAMFM